MRTFDEAKTMKHSLQNLLIFLALCLCALVAFQWHREMKLRQEIQKLTDTGRDNLENIQTLQGVGKWTEEEVKRLDRLKNELTETVKSNRLQITTLTKDLARSDAEVEKGWKQIEAYKTALQQANERLKQQNGEMKKLAGERNEAVLKHNTTVTEFNELARKWNDLQQQLPTNAPAKK